MSVSTERNCRNCDALIESRSRYCVYCGERWPVDAALGFIRWTTAVLSAVGGVYLYTLLPVLAVALITPVVAALLVRSLLRALNWFGDGESSFGLLLAAALASWYGVRLLGPHGDLLPPTLLAGTAGLLGHRLAGRAILTWIELRAPHPRSIAERRKLILLRLASLGQQRDKLRTLEAMLAGNADRTGARACTTLEVTMAGVERKAIDYECCLWLLELLLWQKTVRGCAEAWEDAAADGCSSRIQRLEKEIHAGRGRLEEWKQTRTGQSAEGCVVLARFEEAVRSAEQLQTALMTREVTLMIQDFSRFEDSRQDLDVAHEPLWKLEELNVRAALGEFEEGLALLEGGCL